jgi:dinuclear metal center YbgI/SA1388 family protein
MIIKEVISILEGLSPIALQEGYDNSGLSVGNKEQEVSGILCTLDVTMEVLEEAIQKKANLIVSHHPVIFQGLKSLTGKNNVEKIVIKAIQNNIALYAGHTNFDNAFNGVNKVICNKIGLSKLKILSPLKDKLVKLVTFVPVDNAEKVRQAIFDAGAGVIGNYDSCSYNTKGEGTFRGNENTNPFVGEQSKLHKETEVRIETILPSYLQNKVITALILAHPYEEVAYDLYPLNNSYNSVGAGMIGELPDSISANKLLQLLQTEFKAKGIRFAGDDSKKIKRIAVCGGSGSFLINDAIRNKADVFITGDIKYHQFFDNHNELLIIDIGHFESEQFTKELFYEVLTKNLPKFAVHLSEIKTNPIKYFS